MDDGQETQEHASTSLKHRSVRVGPSQVGQGVFARRPYPAAAVVGEITGEFIDDPTYSSEYCIEIDGGMSLEPIAPFRFLNHSCEPNCEFDFLEPEDSSIDSHPDDQGRESVFDHSRAESFVPEVLLFALRNIESGEELTIDYNWPATHAIPCQCGAARCRGWVVSEDAVDDV